MKTVDFIDVEKISDKLVEMTIRDICANTTAMYSDFLYGEQSTKTFYGNKLNPDRLFELVSGVYKYLVINNRIYKVFQYGISFYNPYDVTYKLLPVD